jgi:hypothetical protein
MIVPSQLALKTHTNLGCAASFATLNKLVDKFTLPSAALTIGDASLTHVIKLAAHSTTSPTPTAMRIIYNRKKAKQIVPKNDNVNFFPKEYKIYKKYPTEEFMLKLF